VEYVETIEERRELCSVASKIVSLKIVRTKEGVIIGFDCASSSPTCESRCTYRMLIEDF